jgi:hypothetical protein
MGTSVSGGRVMRNSWNAPVFISFSDTGDAGNSGADYWTDTQTGTLSQNLILSSGPYTNTTQLAETTGAAWPLSDLGSTATFFDAPGNPLCGAYGCIRGGTETWTFNNTATVTNGGQTATCSVEWSLTLTWTKGANGTVRPTATVILYY